MLNFKRTMITTLAFLSSIAVAISALPAKNCDTETVRALARINNHFGKELLDPLSKKEGNLFFSPSSLSSLLGAIYLGAKGQTARDLTDLRYLSVQYENISSVSPHLAHCLELLITLKSTSDDYALERANALLIQKDYPILEEYKDTLRKYFGVLAKEIDFAGHSENAVLKVNRWVRDKTHGKISKLVNDLDITTRLLLLSAIYFKGTWQTEFHPENTKPRPFYNNGNNSPKSVPTMKVNSKFPYLFDEENKFQALQLPYKGNDVSMLILLPFERDGIEKLQQNVTYETILDVLERVRETNVRVSLPKFKIEFSKNLKNDLIAAGSGALFSVDADFSGITGNKDVYVSDIVHKAVVEVNEEGSEAAAVSGGIILISNILPNVMNEFNVDHPFLFFIVDNRSGSNLFVGRVNAL